MMALRGSTRPCGAGLIGVITDHGRDDEYYLTRVAADSAGLSG